MCGMTKGEILRAILVNLRQHDFDVHSKFEITDEEGAVLLEALDDYRHMCEAQEFYYVPFPAEVFNSETPVKRGQNGEIISGT